MHKHGTPTNNGKYIKQYINNNRTTALEQTVAQATECVHYYCLDCFAVIKAILFGIDLELTHYDGTKERADGPRLTDSQS